MKPRIPMQLAVALAALALAGPATAQVTTRDHRTPPPATKPPPPPAGPVHKVQILTKVDSFGPQNGRPGTRVTILGTGFSKATAVLFGGTKARITKLSPTSITFQVPSVFADGTIVLRKPGVAADMPVGSFLVLIDPVIRAV